MAGAGDVDCGVPGRDCGVAALERTVGPTIQLARDPRFTFCFEPEVVNPGGDLTQYYAQTQALLDSGIRHVVGCYTSSSRKEVLPLFERRDGEERD